MFAVSPFVCSQDSPAGDAAVEQSAEKPSWSAADTKLANHYIQILQKDPAYGNVLDLLWNLYDKKNQTTLLLDYFKGASAKGPRIARLIYAHLLRKSGDLDAARPLYDEVLEADPANLPALRALAEIADQQKRFGKALSLYTRLVELIPDTEEEGISLRLRKASLHRLQGQTEAAVADWNELLTRFPGNVQLRTEIVSLLLEAGETKTAVEVLSGLANSSEVRQKLDALVELNRLYEFVGDFDGATGAAREALALLHFKNHEYANLFSRMVRAHERFDRLPELEASLKTAVDAANPTEQSLFDLAEFHRLTANPSGEEETVRSLVERLPGDLDYRIRLSEIQMRNDHYEAAAATLDELLRGKEDTPLRLVLLRARVALHGEGREAATRLLSDYLSRHNVDADGTRRIIDFARENYLDELVERLLSEPPGGEGGNREQVPAPVELARFLHERGRKEQAVETLKSHVASAEATPLEKASRLFQIASVLRDLDQPSEALAAIDEAILIAPDKVDYLSAKVDLFVDSGEIEKAIAQLEVIWEKKEGFDERSEVDQRLFSLLRGHYSSEVKPPADLNVLQGGSVQSLAEYRRLAAAASQVSRSGDEPPPRELLDYYGAIKDEANREPNTSKRYRAAWWALKLQDNQECFQQLTKANEEEGKPIVEIEKMLLTLAELNERPTLMVRHLSTLIEIDPENADDYRQKRAEMRFELGFEDEAVRELKELASKPDAPLTTLSTLAKVYQMQGNASKQIEVWQHAYREADIFEKRSIIKQLSTALIETGRPEEALQVQIELLQKETDPVQRRKQLDAQLTLAKSHYLLDPMRERYSELGRQHPFDRFYPEALARIQQASGNDIEAFEAMKKAYYMSGQDEDLLGELGELSHRLGDLKSAIYYRRQLLTKGVGDDLENWKALIAMLEKDLRVGEADLLRKRLETKFGTDTDFLKELSDHYLKNGRLRDAGRTLSRLVELRGWDLEARFDLALLQIEREETKAAFETLKKILSDTEDVKYPEGFGEKLLPLIRVATLPEDLKRTPGSELDAFVFTIEEYPFTGGTLQDEIADALQEERPEFRFSPVDPHLIRLRALEEASALAASLGETSAWLGFWNRGERPLMERLWATRYSLAKSAFGSLLNELPDSESYAEQLFFAYSTLLAGQADRLVEWVHAESSTKDTQHPRSVYAAMASLILLKDNSTDPLCDPETVYRALEGLPVGKSVATHLFSELRESRNFEKAFRVGRIFADSVMKDEGGFLFALSQVAGMAGKQKERETLLNLSLDSLNSTNGSGISNHFYAALTERLSLLENDGARSLYLKDLAMIPGQETLGESERVERELLLALAARDNHKVIALLGKLVDRQLVSIRPESADKDQLTYRQGQSWQRMSQILHFYSDRLSLTRETGPAFVSALGGELPGLSTIESVNALYEQFEIDRGILGLEWMDAAERKSQVLGILGFLREPESRMELGKALEGRSFHREAVPVYRADALARENDYAPLQGLFDAAAEALDPQPALAIINQINTREFPAPPGLTVDYLNEQHARFLLLDRDIERLVQLSRPPDAGDNAPPVTSRAHIPYQAALVEAYRQSGRDSELLGLLTTLRGTGTADNTQILMGSLLLEKAGRHTEALEWLKPVSLDPEDPAVQRQAIFRSIGLHRALRWKNPEALRELALASLDQQPAGVSMELAFALHQSGASDEAESVLKLLRRKSTEAAQRSEVSLALIRMAREKGATWESLSEEVEALFQDFVYAADASVPQRSPEKSRAFSTNAYRLAEWIASDRMANEDLVEILGKVTRPRETLWIGELIIGFLRNRLGAAASSAYADSDQKTAEEILETLPAFGPAGIEAARAIVGESGKPGTDFFRNEPERQISFFHRIGDRTRLIEVHTQLVRESGSDLFHQSGLDDWFPTLDVRGKLPLLFASLGEKELATSLFRTYDRSLATYQWNHLTFLNDHLDFLIGSGDYLQAEKLLKEVLRKSLRIDLRLVPRLYHAQGQLDRWEEKTRECLLTRGQEVMIRDWASALAEGREMVEAGEQW